jgi:hypothetical protein
VATASRCACELRDGVDGGNLLDDAFGFRGSRTSDSR